MRHNFMNEIDGRKASNDDIISISKKDNKNTIIIDFEKSIRKTNAKMNRFEIRSKVFIKIESIVNYINYFIKYYDDDNELLENYYKVRCNINLNPNYYYEKPYAILNDIFTPSLINKIGKFVDNNFVYLDTNKSKDLMKISFAMKLVLIPFDTFINTLKSLEKIDSSEISEMQKNIYYAIPMYLKLSNDNTYLYSYFSKIINKKAADNFDTNSMKIVRYFMHNIIAKITLISMIQYRFSDNINILNDKIILNHINETKVMCISEKEMAHIRKINL